MSGRQSAESMHARLTARGKANRGVPGRVTAGPVSSPFLSSLPWRDLRPDTCLCLMLEEHP